MGIPKTKDELFNYADYLSWKDEKRWEIVNGIAYNMTPAPGTRHQQVSGALFATIYNYLKGKNCSVFSAPIDVCLAENAENEETINNVVQPDITVVCDKQKINEKGLKGVPDWIIEIISPSTVKYDFGTKLLLYQKFAVKEYWIVDPFAKTINVYITDNSGKYNPERIYAEMEEISPTMFPDLKINLNDVFSI